MSDANTEPGNRATREALELEKLRVAVNKIIAETAKINREVDLLLRAQVDGITAETAKITREVGWYPFAVGGGVAVGLVGAGAALAGVVIRALG